MREKGEREITQKFHLEISRATIVRTKIEKFFITVRRRESHEESFEIGICNHKLITFFFKNTINYRLVF